MVIELGSRTGSGGQSILSVNANTNTVSIGNFDNYSNSYSYNSGILSTTTTGSNPRSVAVSGNYAYVVNPGSDNLQIFDIVNPTAPVLESTTPADSNPRSVAVFGNYAYVLNSSSNNMEIFDIVNPTAPVLEDTIATGSYPIFVSISSNYAYVVNGTSNTLQIFNVLSPTAPVLDSTTTTNSSPYSVAVSGNYAYVVNEGSSNLQIFNVSNPSSVPAALSTTSTGTNPYSIVVEGDFAYVVNANSNSLQIFNISNPSSVSLVSTTTTNSYPRSVVVFEDYAYLINENSNSLQIFNISSPASPTLVDTTTTGSLPYWVTVSGNYVYVVNYSSYTLQIFNIYAPPNNSNSFNSTTNLSGLVNIQGSTSGFVSTIANQNSASLTGSLSSSSDGLLIELGTPVTSWTTGNTFLAFGDSSGNIDGSISGVAGGGVSYNVNGADYSEYFIDGSPSTPPTKGQLVSLSSTTNNAVIASNNTAPIGIVSTSPGFIGNGPVCNIKDPSCQTNYINSHVIVALTGQVPTKVSIANGNINIGDPITSSSTTGVGQKATSPGYIIGYAESSTTTNGTIQVLIEPGYYNPNSATNLQGANPIVDSMTVNGALTGQSLNITGNTSLNTLTVTTNAVIDNNLSIGNNLSVLGMTIVNNLTINGHIITSGATPTVTTTTNAGTNAVVTITGNDTSGTITLTTGQQVVTTNTTTNKQVITGTNPTSGPMLMVVFSKVYGTVPAVVLTSGNSPTASLQVYVTATTNSFNLGANEFNLQPNTQYVFYYHVLD